MMKYSFLVYHADYKAFLKELKQMGVLHVQVKKQEATPEMQDLLRAYNDLLKTIRSLSDRVKNNEVSGEGPRFADGAAVWQRVREIEAELEQRQQQMGSLEKEAQLLLPWGDFSPERLEDLKESGLYFRFLVCRDKYFDPAWEQEYYLQKVSAEGGFTYFVLLQREAGAALPEWEGVDETLLPARSLSDLRNEQKALEAEVLQFNEELDLLATHQVRQLEAYAADLKSELDEANVLHQTQSEVEDHVRLIEGWVPQPKMAGLNAELDRRSILYVASRPTDDDKVPVQLKNNRFARVFESIGDLYELPNHKELDLVPFFAPFYMLFFGFSLGDAGYGLIILLAAIFAKYKVPKMRSIMTLAQWLGLATVVFGALTGTFFGINLIEADIAWLEKWKAYMIDTDKLFNLALILGVIQILFGMVLKVVNVSMTKGFAYAYATIGWLLLIVGSGLAYGLRELGAVSESVGSYLQNGVLIASGALILLFNHPRRSIVMNFLSGLWDVYGMVTGLVGDLLSYIRLFALGVSSAILGFVFNELAMSLRPDNVIFGPLVMIIILLVGHGMTLFMAGLGAFVHPIRLTFVEFYKNAGFTGGGKRYTPFAEKSLE
ncbi:V-type ATP synthase subunit I [Geofilum rhodophaeum]|uniref:V-type ATP synthase subunit I n=1 Tax=Geofilum rhodophaeum TaxID=1965019 RepID=UPI001F0A1578|nr:V-type ATPase 116kDa subunit family protein [Geofilum rhodophaeum]